MMLSISWRLIWKSYLYIPHRRHLLATRFVNILSLFVDCLFTLLIVYLGAQKILFLVKYKLSIFLLLLVLLVSYFKKIAKSKIKEFYSEDFACFIVLDHTVRSMIHCKLTFVYYVRTSFFCMWIFSYFSTTLPKPRHWIDLGVLPKINWLQCKELFLESQFYHIDMCIWKDITYIKYLSYVSTTLSRLL